uniref:Neur_chan_memb domain-containing protein n=1 Tax=Parastrongyloides trichosuri TaxID=131310 RepID=A0A0N4ZC88_PARTI
MFISISSNEWFLIKKKELLIEDLSFNDNFFGSLDNTKKIEFPDFVTISSCRKVGPKTFWKKLKFGEFVDKNNKTHITTFFGPNKIGIDCITPITASIFYSCIALLFAIISLSIINCVIYIIYPKEGFIGWLVQNSILDMCIITLLIFTLLISTCVKEDIENLGNGGEVNDGPGFYLFLFAIFISILSIIFAFKKSWTQRQRQRENNQRLMSACTLRSLRDVITRPQTGHSADHYERYLLSREDEEATLSTNVFTTCNESNSYN